MQGGRESHSIGEDTNKWFPISTLRLLGKRLTFDECVYGYDVFPHQEYLESIHQLHEDWLIKRTSFPLPAPVLVSDHSYPGMCVHALHIAHRACPGNQTDEMSPFHSLSWLSL